MVREITFNPWIREKTRNKDYYAANRKTKQLDLSTTFLATSTKLFEERSNNTTAFSESCGTAI
jgi:hypothetical protein